MAAPRAIPSERPRVLVAGGGVAALEALLALHELAGRHVHLELLAPGTQFLNRPASVAAPFGLGGPGPERGEDVLADVTPGAASELGLAPGREVWLAVKETSVRTYPAPVSPGPEPS